jgi:hypothetical protein
MRRNIGEIGYPNIRTFSLDDGDSETVLMPLCNMFRIKLTSVATGATLLWRGVAELQTPDDMGADPADTDPLDADFCDVLSETAADSGWIDAQGSGVRIEAVTDSVVVKVMWTSRVKPVIA